MSLKLLTFGSLVYREKGRFSYGLPRGRTLKWVVMHMVARGLISAPRLDFYRINSLCSQLQDRLLELAYRPCPEIGNV
jgi:hypothetical protein